MKDEKKTKAQLIEELEELRQHLSGLEATEAERKQAEEELQRSEEMYRTLLKTSPDAIVVTDLTGKITQVSDRAVEMFAFDNTEELVGKNGFDLLAPKDEERGMERAQMLLEGEYEESKQYEIMRKDGTTFIGEVNASLVKDREGNPASFIVAVRDVTERVRADEELASSKELWERTFGAVIEGLFITDEEYNILQCNSAFTELVGERPEDIVGRKCYRVVHGTENPPERCVSCKAIQMHEDVKAEVYEPFLGRHLEVIANPIPGPRGESGLVVHLFRDITERKLAEEELIRLSNAVRMSTDSIVISDLEGRITEVNEATLKMYGTEDERDLCPGSETWWTPPILAL